ncbi:hypothetical protein [Flavivirga sp. 57AJ16]|nr:hypothetical protein [Flavivirga sp. 57AJ16]MDD7886940.1 hypothetical protein [Flavivirga sp. 57AJ16]
MVRTQYLTFLIGEKQFRGKGLGSQIVDLMMSEIQDHNPQLIPEEE